MQPAVLSPSRWNALVRERGGSFLQSWEWGEFQTRLGRNVMRISHDRVPVLLLRHRLPFGMRFWYAPQGPALRGSSAGEREEIFHAMVRCGQKDGSMCVRVEPIGEDPSNLTGLLDGKRFKKTNSVQPDMTRVIDLRKDIETISKEMEYATRYAIRVAERREVRAVRARGPEERRRAFTIFRDLFEATNRRHRLSAYPKSYYEELLSLEGECVSDIWYAVQGEKPLSAAIFVSFGKTVTYLYSASAEGYGRLNAPTFLLWNVLLAAKEKGASFLDLWGISHVNKRWAGLTAFKKGFGGNEVAYAGTWDFILRPGPYCMYQLLKRLKP